MRLLNQAEEVVVSDSEREIRREVTLHAERDEVWQALTEPDLVRQWLADEADLDLHEGGEVVLRYDGGEERRGRVEEIVRRERLRIRWRRDSRGESDVEFVLADAAAGTRLVVIESVSLAGPRSSVGAWDERLFALEVVSLGLRSGALLPA